MLEQSVQGAMLVISSDRMREMDWMLQYTATTAATMGRVHGGAHGATLQTGNSQ